MNKTPLILLGILVLAIVVGGFIYFRNSSSQATQTTQNNTVSTTLPTTITSTTVSPSDTTAVVKGTVAPNGSFTSYWYEYGATPDLGSKTTNQTVGSGFIAIQAPAYITGLVKNTTYYFKLVAENQYGKVSGSQYSFRTTEGTTAPTGSVPTVKTISASDISRTTANLNGEVTPNKSGTQYWFEYGKTEDG